jgi:hypothetical protein
MEKMRHIIRESFKDLEFNEEKHIYSVGGKAFNGSVSKLIETFYEKFDAPKIAQRTAKYRGITKEEVLAEWAATNKEAIDRGNRVHIFGELYPFNRGMKPSCPQEKAVVKFWEELPEHIIPVGVEIKMYHKIFRFPGTADILLFNTKNQEYIIADYKTNKDLFKNFKEKKMLGMFSKFLDNPFNHYQIQLSFYQILLQQLGINVYQRTVIWLQLDGTYRLYHTQDLTEDLNKYLLLRHEDNRVNTESTVSLQ